MERAEEEKEKAAIAAAEAEEAKAKAEAEARQAEEAAKEAAEKAHKAEEAVAGHGVPRSRSKWLPPGLQRQHAARLRRPRLHRCGPLRARDREQLEFGRCPRRGFPTEAREERRDQSPGPPGGQGGAGTNEGCAGGHTT